MSKEDRRAFKLELLKPDSEEKSLAIGSSNEARVARLLLGAPHVHRIKRFPPYSRGRYGRV